MHRADAEVTYRLTREVEKLLRGRPREALSIEERTRLAVLVGRIDQLVGEQREPGRA